MNVKLTMRLAGIGLLMLCASWYHPIHVSVTNIDLDPGRGTVEFTVKIFADDFQDLILHRYGVQLRITEQENPGDKIESVNRYISESLRMEINGNPPGSLQFQDSRINEGAIWLHYKYEYGNRIRNLRIWNTLMLEKFDDQTNLMIVAYDDKENGYRMDNKTTELTLDIKE
jgi:hypothetical protein